MLINANKRSKSHKPLQANLYFHKDKYYQTSYHFTYHVNLQDTRPVASIQSSAKISMHKLADQPYPDDAKGYIRIYHLNNKIRRYRVGTALIQTAVEFSLQKGLGGRLCLWSRYKSGLFYFKLGFMPRNQDIFKRLKKGEKISGGSMYLPQASIDAWKEKISNQPTLFPTESCKIKKLAM